jgi:hypothetical protein
MKNSARNTAARIWPGGDAGHAGGHGQQQKDAGGRHLAARQGLALGGGLEGDALVQAPADPEHHHSQQGPDDERHAPAPGLQVGLGKTALQHDQHAQGQQLAGDQGHVVEA